MALLNRRERAYLEECCRRFELNFDPNKRFLDNLFDLISSKEPTQLVSDVRISNNKIKKIYHEINSSEILYKSGYVKIGLNKSLVGMCLKKTEGNKFNNAKLIDIIKEFLVFKIDANSVSLLGHSRVFKKNINQVYKRTILRRITAKNPLSSQLFVKKLFNIEKKSKCFIYKLHLERLTKGKNIRIKLFSDDSSVKQSLGDHFDSASHFFGMQSLDDLKLKNIKNIGFVKDNIKSELHIRRWNENQYLIKFANKEKDNFLTNCISRELNLGDCDNLIEDFNDDRDIISDFFRESQISSWARINTYNRILINYSKYLGLNENEPFLKEGNVYKDLKKLLSANGYKISKLFYKKKNRILFPKKKGKKSKDYFLRITKDDKILGHILLGHTLVHKKGINEILRTYYSFIPFILLDFRKTSSKEYFESEIDSLLYSSGDFIYNLSRYPNKIIELLTQENKVLKSEGLSRLVLITKDILSNLNSLNKSLGSKEKGDLFECLCFCLLSKILMTTKIGNRLNPDGKFILEDKTILYDAKNLKYSNKCNTLLKSVTSKRGRSIKDIDYIKRYNVKNYIFILNGTNRNDFLEVKNKIESEVTCSVSGIKINQLVRLVDKLSKDRRAYSDKQIKKILCSATL